MKRISENEREGWGETSNMYPIKTDLLTECTQYSEPRKNKKKKQDVMFMHSDVGLCGPFYCCFFFVVFFFVAKSSTQSTSCQIKCHKNKRAVWKVSFLSSLVTKSIDA